MISGHAKGQRKDSKILKYCALAAIEPTEEVWLGCRLATVGLVDAHLCTDAGKYISALLLSLSSMLHLELPHVNVLSKADMIEAYGELHFNLEYFTEVCSSLSILRKGAYISSFLGRSYL